MKVSVIIPVYNADRFVAEAVASALAQAETGEVLLIEDGSPDGSLAVCERLAAEDDRVKLLRHPGGENRGAGESRNVGIRRASYPYIAFLDADDYFLPGRFRVARQRFEADPEVDGVYEAVGNAYEDETVKDWWFGSFSAVDVTTVSEEIPPEELLGALTGGGKGRFCTDGLVVHRRIFDRTGLFDSLRMCQDQMMWLKMAAVGRLVGGSIREPVAMRRLHGENRIFRHRDEHDGYRRAAACELLRWGRRSGLPRDRMVGLLNYHLSRAVAMTLAESRWRGLAAVAGIAARYPWAWRIPRYRNLVKRALGLSGQRARVRNWARGILGRG